MAKKTIDGIDLIAKERYEQITKHGRTIEHDVKYNRQSELYLGAMAILEKDLIQFPSNWDGAWCARAIQKSYKERLIIAGAFIAAELDLLQALEGLENPENIITC